MVKKFIYLISFCSIIGCAREKFDPALFLNEKESKILNYKLSFFYFNPNSTHSYETLNGIKTEKKEVEFNIKVDSTYFKKISNDFILDSYYKIDSMGYYFFYMKHPSLLPNYSGYVGRIRYNHGLLNTIDTIFSRSLSSSSEGEVKTFGRNFINSVVKQNQPNTSRTK